MKTKIFETILQWVPASKKWMNFDESKDETLTQYILLKRTAHFCIEKMNATEVADVEMAKEVIKVINILVQLIQRRIRFQSRSSYSGFRFHKAY